MGQVAFRVGRALALGGAWLAVVFSYVLLWTLLELTWTFSLSGPRMEIKWSKETIMMLGWCAGLVAVMGALTIASQELLDCLTTGIACAVVIVWWLADQPDYTGHPAWHRWAMAAPAALPVAAWAASVWRVRTRQRRYGSRSSEIRDTNGT